MNLNLLFLSGVLMVTQALDQYRMPVYYLDADDHCQSGTKVTMGNDGTEKAGIIFSHSPFNQPYPGGERNCIITLWVAPEYKIRLSALEFAVNGTANICTKDSLHVFDHDRPYSKNELGDGPGRILGKFCGRIKNNTKLAESSFNALTVWWHPGRRDSPHTRTGLDLGFKLLWTAFRRPTTGYCNKFNEFSCTNGDCIHSNLACDQYANCEDQSDTNYEAAKKLGCKGLVTKDGFSMLHGAGLAVMCAFAVIGSVCCCVAAMICYRSCCGAHNHSKQTLANNNTQLAQQTTTLSIDSGSLLNKQQQHQILLSNQQYNPIDYSDQTTTLLQSSNNQQPQRMGAPYQIPLTHGTPSPNNLMMTNQYNLQNNHVQSAPHNLPNRTSGAYMVNNAQMQQL